LGSLKIIDEEKLENTIKKQIKEANATFNTPK